MAIEIEPPELGRLHDTSIFWRVSAWGGAASVALAAAVLITQTEIGAKRLKLAFSPEAAATRTVAQADLGPRPGSQGTQEAELANALRLETQRLQAQVRDLTADRDRLSARVASVERNLSDMTGSIKRDLALVAATAPPTKPPALSAPPTTAQTATPTGATGAAPASVTAQSGRAEKAGAESTSQARADRPIDPAALPKVAPRVEAKPEAKPEAKLETKPQTTEPQQRAATSSVPMPPMRVAAVEAREPPTAPPGKPELGIELGGARTLEILHARWLAVKANFGPMLEGMYPLVAHDRRPHVIPYRLLVGPVPNGAAAAQMCSRFAASRVTCRTTKFVGEQLAQQ